MTIRLLTGLIFLATCLTAEGQRDILAPTLHIPANPLPDPVQLP